ncbi:MAG: hypothetical protein M3299_07815, partial [Thermoproteota archaeon]|nr:hypothetical protein [Thermoproteota archaeon]
HLQDQIVVKFARCNLQVGQHTSYRCQKDGLKTSDCLSYSIVTKSIEQVTDHACSIMTKQSS